MARAIFTKKAKNDLTEIAGFYVSIADVSTAKKILEEIREQALYLAETPLLDKPIRNFLAITNGCIVKEVSNSILSGWVRNQLEFSGFGPENEIL